MRTTNTEQQKGFVMVMVALVLVILIGFVALGVDAGALYSARTGAQEAADAAALAGAYTFINTPLAPQPSTATNYATQIATNNKVLGKAITAADVNVAVDTVNKRVTVSINKTQSTFFAKALGTGSASIGVTAIAEASDETDGGCCTRPWFIPNTVYATTDICTAKCDSSQLLVDPTTKLPTAYSKTKIGQQFLLKPQSPDQALSPSEFYLIDLPDADGKTSGGASYQDSIVNGAPTASACNDIYSVLTGNMVGPTKLGVDGLVGNPPNYTWNGAGNYKRVSDGKSFDMAPNVILTPIWDVCNLSTFCPDKKMSGTNPSLQIIGFATLFVDGVQGSGVNARLINVAGCGPSSGTEDGSTTFALPLRLIRI
jgi:Flp pilus assembly protein TadG